MTPERIEIPLPQKAYESIQSHTDLPTFVYLRYYLIDDSPVRWEREISMLNSYHYTLHFENRGNTYWAIVENIREYDEENI